jgi:hypothetical protein
MLLRPEIKITQNIKSREDAFELIKDIFSLAEKYGELSDAAIEITFFPGWKSLNHNHIKNEKDGGLVRKGIRPQRIELTDRFIIGDKEITLKQLKKEIWPSKTMPEEIKAMLQGRKAKLKESEQPEPEIGLSL